MVVTKAADEDNARLKHHASKTAHPPPIYRPS